MGHPVIPFRPLGVADVFQASFTIYARRFLQFLILGLLPAAIGLVLALGVIALVLAAAVPLLIDPGTGASTSGVPRTLLFFLPVLFAVALVLNSAFSYTCTGLIALGVVQVNRGQSPTIGSLWRDAPGLLGRALALTAVYIACVLAAGALVGLLAVLAIRQDLPWLLAPAILAAIVAAIVVQARLGLVLQVLAVEGAGAIEAIRGCWRLTQGFALRVFGLLLLVNIIISAASQAISGVAQLATSQIGQRLTDLLGQSSDTLALAIMIPWLVTSLVVTQLVNAVAMPFSGIFSSVLYVDLRRRKETASGLPVFV